MSHFRQQLKTLQQHHWFDYVWICLLALICYFPFLGKIHLFDWDEINFAECAREMIVSKDYLHVQMGFEPFHEKPPLFIWLQVFSMKIFGINEFAARFPNALCGLFTLLLIYSIGKKLHDKKMAQWWVLAYLGSILPHVYFKSGIMDPWFNFLIFSSFYLLYDYQQSLLQQKVKHAWSSLIMGGILLGAALLLKGPVAIIIIALCVFVFSIASLIEHFQKKKDIKFKWPLPLISLCIYFLLAALPMALWYGIDIWKNGWGLFQEFIGYQYRLFRTEDAGHGGFPGYHIVVLLLGCFPASYFALQQFNRNKLTEIPFRKWMIVLFAVVLVLFSIVQSKIIHYSSLCYFPITYLAAISISEFKEGKKNIPSMLLVGLAFNALLFGMLVIVAPFLGQQIDLLKPLLAKDPFAQANLNANVYWSGYESISGFLFLGLIALGFYLLYSKKALGAAVRIWFIATLVMVQSIFLLYIAPVEAYSQRAAIDFYSTLKGKNVYVHPFDYFSYAHFFYAETMPGNTIPRKNPAAENRLFNGALEKDAYFSMKNVSEKKLSGRDLIRLYEKNGFVFYLRKKTNPSTQ